MVYESVWADLTGLSSPPAGIFRIIFQIYWLRRSPWDGNNMGNIATVSFVLSEVIS